METILLKITGMQCEACVAHVKRSLEAVPGVESVAVELEQGQATVRHEGAAANKLVAAVADAGYAAEVEPAQVAET